MPSSESEDGQSRLDEHLRKMRTVILSRLALHLGLSADEHRVQEWVKLYDDAGVWRKIEESQARSWRHFLRLPWAWRAH